MPLPQGLPLGTQSELVTPVLHVAQRMVTRRPLDGAQLKADEGQAGAWVDLLGLFEPVMPIEQLGKGQGDEA